MRPTNEIIESVKQRRGRWPDLAKRADVSYSWLTKFAAHRIPNPGINTLAKIEAAMSDDRQ